MSFARRSGYGLGLLVLAWVVVGVFLPSTGEVRREAVIDAPAATVFVLAREPDRLREWLPWIGPGAGTHIAPRTDAGKAESLRWDAGSLGGGRLTLAAGEPYTRLVATIEFDDGGAAQSTLAIDETDAGTRVRWIFETDFGTDLLARYGGLFLESRAGGALERGLAELRMLAEGLPRADWSEIDIERLVVKPLDIAYLTARSAPNATAISEAMGEAYFGILGFMDRHGLAEAGAALSISRRFSGSEFVFDAAIPVRGVTDATPRHEGGISLGQTYGGPVARGRHLGSYRTLADTHEKIAAYLAVHGISRAGDAWETYVSDPARVPEEQLVTEVYYPIQPR